MTPDNVPWIPPPVLLELDPTHGPHGLITTDEPPVHLRPAIRDFNQHPWRHGDSFESFLLAEALDYPQDGEEDSIHDYNQGEQ